MEHTARRNHIGIFGSRAAAAPRIGSSRPKNQRVMFQAGTTCSGNRKPRIQAKERAARAGTESGSSAWKFPQAALRRAASGTADSELPSRTPCAASEFKRRSSAQRRFPPAPQDSLPQMKLPNCIPGTSISGIEALHSGSESTLGIAAVSRFGLGRAKLLPQKFCEFKKSRPRLNGRETALRS